MRANPKSGRRTIPACAEDRADARQSQYPQTSIALRGVHAPNKARRLIEKLEIHYTPKHGSWLNMAETELGILSRQCLDRRLPDRPKLTTEVAAWERARNEMKCQVDWQFTTADADQTQTPLPCNQTYQFWTVRPLAFRGRMASSV